MFEKHLQARQGYNPFTQIQKNLRNGRLELERVKGFEPSTSTLARLRSTPELRPHHQERII